MLISSQERVGFAIKTPQQNEIVFMLNIADK